WAADWHLLAVDVPDRTASSVLVAVLQVAKRDLRAGGCPLGSLIQAAPVLLPVVIDVRQATEYVDGLQDGFGKAFSLTCVALHNCTLRKQHRVDQRVVSFPSGVENI